MSDLTNNEIILIIKELGNQSPNNHLVTHETYVSLYPSKDDTRLLVIIYKGDVEDNPYIVIFCQRNEISTRKMFPSIDAILEYIKNDFKDDLLVENL